MYNDSIIAEIYCRRSENIAKYNIDPEKQLIVLMDHETFRKLQRDNNRSLQYSWDNDYGGTIFGIPVYITEEIRGGFRVCMDSYTSK
jgi:hypothetical protein